MWHCFRNEAKYQNCINLIMKGFLVNELRTKENNLTFWVEFF